MCSSRLNFYTMYMSHYNAAVYTAPKVFGVLCNRSLVCCIAMCEIYVIQIIYALVIMVWNNPCLGFPAGLFQPADSCRSRLTH